MVALKFRIMWVENKLQFIHIEKAWYERDAALLRDQIAQSQMMKMRDKLEIFEKETKNENKNIREE